MYAVIEAGGKQYRVQPGDIVQIEKLEGDVGTAVKFDRVLFVAKPSDDESKIWVGKPLLAGAAVEGNVVGQGRDAKVMLVKMKRRKQYRRTQGHRQYQTQVLVTAVSNGAGESAKLSESEHKAVLSKFHTHLKPKGLGHTPKTLGTRRAEIRAKREKPAAAKVAKAKKKSE